MSDATKTDDGIAGTSRPGPLTTLPAPTLDAEEIAKKMVEALAERGLSQAAVCTVLAFSPVYFSIFLRGSKSGMPETTKRLYSSACELWLSDPSFAILDPALTRTNPSQVPRAKGKRPAAGSSTSGGGGGGGGGGGAAPKGNNGSGSGGGSGKARRPPHAYGLTDKDRDAAQTTPLLLLEELLTGFEGREVAFQLQPSQGASIDAETGLILIYATLHPSVPDAASAGGSDDGEGEEAGGGAAPSTEASGEPSKADAKADEVADVSDATSTAAGAAPAGGARVVFRREGDPAPFGALFPNGALRSPDESTDEASATMLAVHERPQRYRKTRLESEAANDPQLAAVLKDSLASAPAAETAAAAAAAAPELRKRLLHTLQAMAASPLELRQHKRQASALAGMRWTAFCSVSGRWFEGLNGLQNLACQSGMHAVHARVARLRREELQVVLQRLRTNSSLSTERAAAELRSELENARRLSKLLPDAGLQRALVHAEARLRAIDRARQHRLPQPDDDNAKRQKTE